MNALDLVEILSHRRRAILNQIERKEGALSRFDQYNEARIWGEHAEGRRSHLNNQLTQKRQRLFEIEADIDEACERRLGEKFAAEIKAA